MESLVTQNVMHASQRLMTSVGAGGGGGWVGDMSGTGSRTGGVDGG